MAYWAAAAVWAQSEQRAAHFLERCFGYEAYAPQIREHRLRYGRRVQVLSALFPGYLFVRIELQWRTALWAPGVMRIVQSGGMPVHVPDEVIAQIRKRERNGVITLPRRRPSIGSRVHVISGALAGKFGLYAGDSAGARVNVLMQLLGAQRQVHLHEDTIESV